MRRVRATEHAPTRHRCGTVPAREYDRARAVGTRSDCRAVTWSAAPGEAVGAVRVCAAAAEPRIEQHAAAPVELGEVLVRAPADEEVPVGQHLRVALARREERRRVLEAAHELRRAALPVETQHDRTRLTAGGGPARGVVEERERPVRVQSRVVLPGEARPRREAKTAPLAAEPPQQRAVALADLVNRVRMPCGDEKRAVAVLL